MNKETSLSSKITAKMIMLCGYRWDDSCSVVKFIDLTEEIEEDVREAVRRLKEKIRYMKWMRSDVRGFLYEDIGEIFGSELI